MASTDARPGRGLRAILLCGLLGVQLPTQCPPQRSAWSAQTTARLSTAYGDEILRRPAGLTDPARVGPVLARLDAMPAADRVDLVRLSLWSEDPAVRLGAAMLAEPYWLDVDEARRLAAIALPHSLTLPAPFSFEDFRDVVTPGDMTRELILSAPLPREVYYHIGALHRALRAEHLPLLAEATRSDDWFLRKEAIHYLGWAALWSEEPRDTIALAMLAWNESAGEHPDVDPTESPAPAHPLRIDLPPASDGWSRTLTAVVRRLWFEPCGEDLQRFRAWALRWAMASTTTRADLPLLRELAQVDDAQARAAAVAMLSRFPLDELRSPIVSALEDEEGFVRAIAITALARSEESGWFERLRELAATGDDYAIAGLFGLGAAGIDAVAELAFGPDEAIGTAVTLKLGNALHPTTSALLPPPPDLGAQLATRAVQYGVGGARLAELLVAVPTTRIETLRRRMIESLSPEHLSPILLAVLELTDRDALIARLRALPPPAAPFAARVFAKERLRLGDPERPAAMLAIVDGDDALPPGWLARSASAELVTVLRTRLGVVSAQASRAAIALAAIEGVDEDLAASVLDDDQLVDAALDRFVRDARTSGGRAAVVNFVSSRLAPSTVLRRSGSLDAPSVRTWLERARDDRASGRYAEAVAELALMGDAAARAELRRAQDLGLYTWFDDLPDWALDFEVDPPDPERWFDDLAGNCCAFAAVASRLEDRYEIDAFVSESGLRSRVAVLREVFARHAHDWHYSRCARKWVILR